MPVHKPLNDHFRRTRRWAAFVLGGVDIALAIWAYTRFGAYGAITAAVVFAWASVIAWLGFLWLNHRL
jgi:hypothetical protein